MFISTKEVFYVLRFLLGVAEAGFFPGIIFYLTLWFPAVYRARIVGYFMAAIPLSTVFGAPVSGLLLGLDGMLGLKGWQWLFIIEAVPSLILAGFVLFYLTDRPADARWLLPEERAWLVRRLDAEHAQHVKRDRAADERHGAGNHAPREHDPGDPLPRTEPLQQQVRRHLEDEVGKEEDAGAKPVLRRGQAEVAVHRQGREAHVDPVQIGDEVADHQERHEPGRDLGNRRTLEWIHVCSVPLTAACARYAWSPTRAPRSRRAG
jgi:hypothetical protein